MDLLVVSNILLWVGFLGMAVLLLGALRQIGLLHERSAPMGAMITDNGPDIGDKAPVLELADFWGAPVRIGGQSHAGEATLVMFTAPTCPVCDKLFPILKSLARSEKLDVVLVSDGERVEHERFLASHKLNTLRYVVSAEAGMAFQVGKIPYAVLLDQDGVIRAKGLTNTREHLESLLEAHESGFASLQQYVRSFDDKAA